MPVDRDSEEYNMQHSRRGVFVILNHDTFTTERPRKGSDVDVEALQKTHETLGFEVKVYHNSTVDQIKSLIWECKRGIRMIHLTYGGGDARILWLATLICYSVPGKKYFLLYLRNLENECRTEVCPHPP